MDQEAQEPEGQKPFPCISYHNIFRYVVVRGQSMAAAEIQAQHFAWKDYCAPAYGLLEPASLCTISKGSVRSSYRTTNPYADKMNYIYVASSKENYYLN